MPRHRTGAPEARAPRLAGAVVCLRSILPPLNFITIHYAYFLVTPLVFSLIFWGSSEPAFSISFTDSLFLTVSAMTESGLNTVNLSQMTTWQQIILFLLIVFGGNIWVSIWTVAFRKRVFEQRFDTIVGAERARRLRLQRHRSGGSAVPAVSMWHGIRQCLWKRAQDAPENGVLPTVTAPRNPGGAAASRQRQAATGPILFEDGAAAVSSSVAHAQPGRQSVRREPPPPPAPHGSAAVDEKPDGMLGGFHSWSAANFPFARFAGRNSQFHGLTRAEREHLGGYEYRALRLLSILVPLYFCLWQLLGCVALGAWISSNMPSVATSNGISPWWLGAFNGASAFNNSGMSLLDANMIPFENAHFVIVTMGLMILAGNTAYPVFLRLILWSVLRILRALPGEERFSETKATIAFILQYPRRVYTNLFPARPTWWLLFMVVLLNCIDWVAFELLNLGNPVVSSIPTGSRVLDGLFQAIAVRSGGFYIVPIAEVYVGLQVLYVIMMYISVYPVVITIRNSNVYEERSLGIYSDDPDVANLDGNADGQTPAQAGSETPVRELARVVFRAFVPWHGVGVPPLAEGKTPESRISFISQQMHGQLAHDLWWLVLAVLVITTIETSHFLADPVVFSVFNVVFEVVSAYGCVGISMGVPYASYSFSGGWHKASKLVLCLVMIRGRHRGLPVALDRAVRLPGEQLNRDEEEDYRIQRSMTSRRLSIDGGVLVS